MIKFPEAPQALTSQEAGLVRNARQLNSEAMHFLCVMVERMAENPTLRRQPPGKHLHLVKAVYGGRT